MLIFNFNINIPCRTSLGFCKMSTNKVKQVCYKIIFINSLFIIHILWFFKDIQYCWKCKEKVWTSWEKLRAKAATFLTGLPLCIIFLLCRDQSHEKWIHLRNIVPVLTLLYVESDFEDTCGTPPSAELLCCLELQGYSIKSTETFKKKGS